MAKKFPPDELDAVRGIGGRHRRPVTFATRLIGLGKLASVTVVLAGVGFTALSGADWFSQLAGSGTSQQPKIAGFQADGLPVTVIDATGGMAQATKVGNLLANDNWNVISAARAQADGESSATAPTTIIYANSPEAMDGARKVASKLGDYKVKQAATYPDAVTVILGKDFK